MYVLTAERLENIYCNFLHQTVAFIRVDRRRVFQRLWTDTILRIYQVLNKGYTDRDTKRK